MNAIYPVQTIAATMLLFAVLIPAAAGEAVPATGASETSNAIAWNVLAPENGKPFADPFAKLSTDQLTELSYVMRVRRLIAESKIEPDGGDAKEAAETADRLTQQGIDIGWLLVQRGRVQQIRELQAENLSKSIAESLGDKSVSLTGYVIPIKVKDKRLVEFLLVPTIAACSHEDAPPRLQVVFVSTAQGVAAPGRRTAVSVTGKITAEQKARTTFNGNGRVKVHSAYAMAASNVEIAPPMARTDK